MEEEKRDLPVILLRGDSRKSYADLTLWRDDAERLAIPRNNARDEFSANPELLLQHAVLAGSVLRRHSPDAETRNRERRARVDNLQLLHAGRQVVPSD